MKHRASSRGQSINRKGEALSDTATYEIASSELLRCGVAVEVDCTWVVPA